MAAKLTLFSCVGGGPMERLVDKVCEAGGDAELVSDVSAMRWRQLARSGRVGRLRARLGAMVKFPLVAVAHTFRDDVGVLVPTTNPFFVPTILVATKALHGRPVVPLVYDLYPDAVEASGQIKVSKFASFVGSTLNRFLFAHADGVVFIGHRMASHAAKRYGQPRVTAVLHTGASLAEFSVGDDKSENAEASADKSADDLETVCGVDVAGKLVVSYVGNLGHVHDWETLKEGLAHLCRAQPDNLVVIFAASGPGVEYLIRELPAGHESLVHFVGPADDEEWRRLLRATDLALVSLREEAKHTSVPSKTFSAMAANAAVIAVAPRGSDLADVVSRADCGAVVQPGNPLQLLDAILGLSRDPSELARLKANAIEAIEKHYDLDVLAEKWSAFATDASANGEAGFGYALSKRLFDASVAGAAALSLAPVLLGAAVAVRVSMGSPVLFSQDRPGLGGKVFKLFKFRSMRDSKPDEIGPEHDATRLTRVGEFLRATSIDELPALLNVLKGEMSLVGPRPLLVRYLSRYSELQARRHDVLPGITGLAQVRGRNSISWDEKFEHDVEYVEQKSLWLDLKILVATALKVVKRSDISSEGHATMPEFMGSDPTTVASSPS